VVGDIVAKGRMFALKVVDSEEFIELPLQAQALYFHLGVRADDDGFVRNPHAIMRMLNVRRKYLDDLLMYNFVIEVSKGVIVQTHWLTNNTIRKDRYTPTVYQEEFKKIKATNGVYSLVQSNDGIPTDNQVTDKCQPTDNQVDTDTHPQDKISKDKTSKGNLSCSSQYIPSLEDITNYINNNNYTFNAEYFYNYYKGRNWYIGNKPIESFEALKAIMDNWQVREKPQQIKQAHHTSTGSIFMDAGQELEREMKGGDLFDY
jgi:hypothetical protein